MVVPIALAGIAAGASLLGGYFGQSAARREQDRMRDFWKSQLQQRREGAIGQTLQGIFDEQTKDLKNLPGYLKREREGRLASAASERMSRFQRNLARSGATRASSVGMLGERGISSDIERMNQQGMIGEQRAIGQARGQTMQSGQNLMNALYGSPGQSVQGLGQQQQEVYFNPMQPIMAGLTGYGIGMEYNQTGSTRSRVGPA